MVVKKKKEGRKQRQMQTEKNKEKEEKGKGVRKEAKREHGVNLTFAALHRF